MNVLLVTDSFPPVCGGSGWSTWELARGLSQRGQQVLVVKVTAGKARAERETSHEGLRVIEFHAFAPSVPGLRNYFKNERLYARLMPRLAELIASGRIDVVHGQHVMSGPPSVLAAKRAGIPSVVTVRDYWPVCYRSDLMHSPATLALCPGCSRAAGMSRGRPRVGVTGLGTWLAQSYLRGNMQRKAAALAAADAVIAVSSVIARDLRMRAPELSGTRMEVIPNPVNIAALRQLASGPRPIAGPYALYVGKLAPNKGTDHLVDVVREADLDWPLVVLGDGPGRAALEADARRSRREIRCLGWLGQRDVARWTAHAGMLIFPSRGPESLSRVLIEASALGVPIAAMNTGGTSDIVEDEVTGLLSDDVAGLAEDVRRIRHGEVLRHRLGAAAANRAAERFDAPAVVGRIDALYAELQADRRR
jgi:glycosyltransferase involved in cell wall biosynthesis